MKKSKVAIPLLVIVFALSAHATHQRRRRRRRQLTALEYLERRLAVVESCRKGRELGRVSERSYHGYRRLKRSVALSVQV